MRRGGRGGWWTRDPGDRRPVADLWGVLPVAPGARALRPAPVSRSRRGRERSEARLTMHHRHHHHHRAHHGGGHLDGGLDAERERCHAAIMHPDRSKGKTLFTFRNGAGGCAVGGGAVEAGAAVRELRAVAYGRIECDVMNSSRASNCSQRRTRYGGLGRPRFRGHGGRALSAQHSRTKRSQPSFPGPAMSAPAAQHQQGVLEVRGGAVG